MAENQQQYDVFPIYPIIFRRTCSRCGNGFRLEWGWKNSAGNGVWRYLCIDCAPNFKVARGYFILLDCISRIWRNASKRVKSHG